MADWVQKSVAEKMEGRTIETAEIIEGKLGSADRIRITFTDGEAVEVFSDKNNPRIEDLHRV